MAAAGSRSRLLGWVAVLAATVALLTVAVVDQGGAESDGERIQRLQASFACPECKGQSVSDSNAAVAVTIRDFIADEVAAGSSDEEIRDQLVAAYDARILLNPPADGFAALIWVLPVVMVVAGAVVLGAAVTRGQGSDRQATAEDEALLALAREKIDADPGAETES